MLQNKKKNINRNINASGKPRNTDMRFKQLVKGENDSSSNNLLNSNKTLSINISQQNINNNISNSVNISNIMTNSNNKNNTLKNNNNDSEFSPIYENNNKTNISEFAMDNPVDNSNQKSNYDEYFDVIKNINKKNVIKNAKKKIEYTDDDNIRKRGKSVNNNNSIVINSLNKNDNDNKNKKNIKTDNLNSLQNNKNIAYSGKKRVTS